MVVITCKFQLVPIKIGWKLLALIRNHHFVFEIRLVEMFLKGFVTILLFRCSLCAFKSSKITFRSVHCAGSTDFVYKNISCTKLGGGRSLATKIYFKKPIDEFLVSFKSLKVIFFQFCFSIEVFLNFVVQKWIYLPWNGQLTTDRRMWNNRIWTHQHCVQAAFEYFGRRRERTRAFVPLHGWSILFIDCLLKCYQISGSCSPQLHNSPRIHHRCFALDWLQNIFQIHDPWRWIDP